jgi:DnaJ-class molecular chaperone
MEDLIKHLRYRIMLHETVGDYEISTETLKIILDEWESKALSQHDVIKNEVAVCPVCDGRGSGNFGGEAFTEECDSCEGTGKTVL